MKCIHCGNDAKYKDRSSRKCPTCRHKFAFEPKDGDRMTDMAFKTAIDAVSAKGRLRWGVEHLYYEVCRRLRRKEWHWGCFALLCFVPVIMTLIVKSFWPLASIPVGAFVWALLRTRWRSSVVNLDKAVFDSMWSKWLAAHGKPAGLIQRPDAPPPKREREPDLDDYSFDRAVICDRARTVDLLLANNFHFENNCAVLSISGYPQGPFETVRAMLKRNPRLQVFVLHDATVEGCRLAYLLATSPDWFKGQGEIIDVGLRPRHRKPFAGLYLPSPGAVTASSAGLAPDEVEWLGRYSLELAAIRPEQILKRLYRAITRKTDISQPERDFGDASVDFDNESFSADAGDSEGSADGFG
jgi:hypothetical protein